MSPRVPVAFYSQFMQSAEWKHNGNIFSKVILKLTSQGIFALFVVSGPIKQFFSIDSVNIYIFSIFFPIGFARWKSARSPYIAYIVIY